MYNNIKFLLLIMMLINMSGCAITEIFQSPARQQGADSLFPSKSGGEFENINLFDLLDPQLEYERDKNGCYPAGKYEDETDYPAGCISLEIAWEKYNRTIDGRKNERGQKINLKPEEKKLWRSRIQDRIIAASNQRCADFQRELHKYEGDVSFLLGASGTAFAGAGAIFTRANTVRALSGIAGILSGTKAEFSDSYFRTKSIEVITKGLSAKRKRQRECMLRKAVLPLEKYTTAAAIADAILYHGSCNVVKGLEEASDSITKVENPGQKAVIKSLELAIKIRKTADTLSDLASDSGGDSGSENDSTEAALANAKNEEETAMEAEQIAAVAEAKAIGGDSADKIAAAEARIKAENAKKKAETAKKIADIKSSALNAKAAVAKANEAAAEALAKAAAKPGDVTLQKNAKLAVQAAKDAKVRDDAIQDNKNDFGEPALEVCI